MNQEKIEQLCTDYVFGSLNEDDEKVLEALLKKDPTVAELLNHLSGIAGPMHFEAEAKAPNPALKQRIMAQITSQDSLVISLRQNRKWEMLCPGIEQQILFHDPETDSKTILIRMAAGHDLPEHPHHGTEELFILEGDCTNASGTLDAGDYHRAVSGSEHGTTSSLKGCQMLVRTTTEIAEKTEQEFFVMKKSDGEWLSRGGAHREKVLFSDSIQKRTSMLIRIEPGGHLRAPAHDGAEELYLLEGDCVCMGQPLQRGDYHRIEGSKQGATTTENGCMMFISSPDLKIPE